MARLAVRCSTVCFSHSCLSPLIQAIAQESEGDCYDITMEALIITVGLLAVWSLALCFASSMALGENAVLRNELENSRELVHQLRHMVEYLQESSSENHVEGPIMLRVEEN